MYRQCNSRLPDRLPVGATYVVEGFGGDEGNFRVIARYIVLPGGRRINVPGRPFRPGGAARAGFAATGDHRKVRAENPRRKPR